MNEVTVSRELLVRLESEAMALRREESPDKCWEDYPALHRTIHEVTAALAQPSELNNSTENFNAAGEVKAQPSEQPAHVVLLDDCIRDGTWTAPCGVCPACKSGKYEQPAKAEQPGDVGRDGLLSDAVSALESLLYQHEYEDHSVDPVETRCSECEYQQPPRSNPSHSKDCSVGAAWEVHQRIYRHIYEGEPAALSPSVPAYALFAIIGVGVLWAVTRNLEHDSEGDSGHDRDPHE